MPGSTRSSAAGPSSSAPPPTQNSSQDGQEMAKLMALAARLCYSCQPIRNYERELGETMHMRLRNKDVSDIYQYAKFDLRTIPRAAARPCSPPSQPTSPPNIKLRHSVWGIRTRPPRSLRPGAESVRGQVTAQGGLGGSHSSLVVS